MRGLIQRALRRAGYQLVRNTQPAPSVGVFHDPTAPVPAPLQDSLRPDHPRLLELRRRYAASTLPMLGHTWWNQDYVNQSLDLTHFRGDNVYVWQTRHMRESAPLRYYLYACDVAARDRLGLFQRLSEDGSLGCWVYSSRRFPALSRDLLDSVNELNFLDRHAQLSTIDALNVLDIGAGYGRLAHRAHEALPNLQHYYCTDAVAESTFLSEAYLRFRGCHKARVVPADELDTLPPGRIQLAINVHSFSEMSLQAIEGWLDLIVRLKIPRLFVVPNDAEAFLSMESDGSRRDFEIALTQRGFRLVASEPVIADPDTRELVGVHDHLFLFERSRPA